MRQASYYIRWGLQNNILEIIKPLFHKRGLLRIVFIHILYICVLNYMCRPSKESLSL